MLRSLMIVIILLSVNAGMMMKDDGSVFVSEDHISLAESIDMNIGFDKGYFIENMGQFDEDLDFVASTGFGNVGIGPEGIFYHVISGSTGIENVVRVEFVDGNQLRSRGTDRMEMVCNFIKGNDPERWASNVPVYESIEVESVYDDIDARFYFSEKGFKYDLIARPGSDPSAIQMRYNGPTEILVEDENIGLKLEGGITLNDGDLYCYFEDSGDEINSNFHRIDENTVTFNLESVPVGKSIVIDPIVYATFLGGTNWSYPEKPVKGDDGTIFLSGRTTSSDFPTTPGAFDRSFGMNETYTSVEDIFLMKMDPTGRYPVFSTFLGGEGRDFIYSIDIAPDGSAVISGLTFSIDFPVTSGSFNDSTEDVYSDGFISRISSDGSSLIFSTFLWWGSGADGIVVDEDHGIVFTGFGIPEGIDHLNTTMGNTSTYCAIVGVLSMDGSKIKSISLIGGSGHDFGNSLIIKDDVVTVHGYTYSLDFPNETMLGGPTPFNYRNFIFKYDLDSEIFTNPSLIYGVSNEAFLLADDQGRTYVMGSAWQDNFNGTEDAFFRSHQGNYDILIMRLDEDLDGFDYLSYFGGRNADGLKDAYFDDMGNLVICGVQSGGDYPVTDDAWSRYEIRSTDISFSILDLENNKMIHSTLLGTEGYDNTIGVVEGGNGRYVLNGRRTTSSFPITDDAHQEESGNMYLIHYTLPTVPSPPRDVEYDAVFGARYHDRVELLGFNLTWKEPLDWGNCKPAGYLIYKWKEGEYPLPVERIRTGNVTYYFDKDISGRDEEKFDYSYQVYAISEYETHSPPSPLIDIEDRKGPIIRVFDIPEYEIPGTSFDPDVDANDPSGIDEIWFEYWYDDNEHRTFTYFNETISHGRITIEKRLGSITFIVFARDKLGNINWSEIMILPIIDTWKPQLQEDWTLRNIMAGEDVLINVTFSDNHMIEEAYVWIGYKDQKMENLTMITTDGINFTLEFQTRWRPGYIEYTIFAIDPSGNLYESSIRRIDITGNLHPIITGNWTPSEVNVGEDIVFKVRINDSMDVKEAWVQGTMGKIFMEYIGDNNWTCTYNWTGDYRDIEYRFYYDTTWNLTFGAEGHGYVNFVDLVFPEISSPSNHTDSNLSTGQTVMFSVDATDDFEMKDVNLHYRYDHDERYARGFDYQTGNTYHFEVKIPYDAKYFHYWFVAYDYVWNSVNSTEFNVSVFDNIFPEIRCFSKDVVYTSDPSLRIYLKITDNIEIDDYWGVARYGEKEWRHDMGFDSELNRYYLNFGFNPWAVGSYYYTVYATDLQGNRASTDTYRFELKDDSPPEISEVKDHIFRAEEELSIECRVVDNIEVKSVRITGVDGLTWEDGYITGSVDDRGIYTVKIIADDISGTSSSFEFTLYIESPQQDLMESDDSWILLILIVVIVILIILVIVQMVQIRSLRDTIDEDRMVWSTNRPRESRERERDGYYQSRLNVYNYEE